MRKTTPVVATAFLVVALAVPAANAQASVPGNLCNLNVKQQLKALPTGSTTCEPAKTAHVGPLAIEGANWGTTDHAIALQVFVNVPKSRFMKQIDKSGAKFSLGNGSVGWEKTGPSGVGLSAWVNGLGVVVLLHTPPGTTKSNDPYRAPVLTFAKAVAKQI